MSHQVSSLGAEVSILQVGALPPAVEETLYDEFSVLRMPDVDFDRFLAEHSGQTKVAVTSSLSGVSGSIMRALPQLQAIINFGVGYETTDVETGRALGIAISNTPDVLTDCVADLAVGLTIDITRRISASDRFVRNGQWLQGPYPLGIRMRGKRIGIVGMGRIGQAIAQRLEGFGCEISYHSRNRVSKVAYPWCDSLSQLAVDSDILVVAVSGGPATDGLISQDILLALGSTGFLINIARGSVIDQQALVDALHKKQIAGAGLDVFMHEPHVPGALFELDNVVLTPHLGSATAETRGDMGDLFLSNLRQFMHEGTLRTPVG